MYRADDNDITYTRNFYNQQDSSLSLIKSKETVSAELLDPQSHLKLNKVFLNKTQRKKVLNNKNGTVKFDKKTP